MAKFFFLVGLMLVLSGPLFGQVPATATEAAFADWDYSPTGVYGLKRLTSTAERYHVKIKKLDPATVRIQRFSSNGQPGDTTVVQFSAGRIAQVTDTNRWGYTYEVAKFTPAARGVFIVTRVNAGSNSYLPAKAVRETYRNGLLAESRYVSFDGKPIANSSGVAAFRYTRYIDGNRYGQLKEISYFDEDDKPVISSSQDCHKIVYEYDTNGNLVTTTYLGLDDEPLTNRFGGYRTRSTYDPTDHLLSSTTIGPDDKPVNNAYGIAATVWEYKKGMAVRATRYDAVGNVTRATAAGDGLAVITYEYDANGYESLRTFYDERNLPLNTNAGYGKVAYRYSKNGMLESVAYLDKTGLPATDRQKIHRYEYVRDDKGRVIQQSYFDKTGAPMKNNTDEVFIIRSKFDEEGRRSSVSYWQSADVKMNRWDGTHETVYKFDQHGQVTEAASYDQNGKFFVSDSGYSRFVNTYDKSARWIERSYFNGTTPVSLTKGFADSFHMIQYSYDGLGRVSELRYFDTARQPVNAKIQFDGQDAISVHRIEFRYNANRIIEERLYPVNSTTASVILDCLKNDYVDTSGINIGRKNQ